MHRTVTLLLAAAFAPSLAYAQTMPAGTYAVTVSGFGKPSTTSYCLAESTVERALTPTTLTEADCPRRDIRKSGNTITLDFVCKEMSVKGTGTFAEGTYHSDMTMVMEGMPPTHVITDVKRTGPCKPGEKPMLPN